jgi:hypothetical protein
MHLRNRKALTNGAILALKVRHALAPPLLESFMAFSKTRAVKRKDGGCQSKLHDEASQIGGLGDTYIMRVRVPVIVKDPEVSEWKDIDPTENVDIESEETFLDGPISPRVAVLDFEPGSGRISPGVPFVPPKGQNDRGYYKIAQPILAGQAQVSPEAGAVSTFGAVHKTIKLFEEADALGRRITWAFDGPQLLVVPRAGEWANAYYERESHSLQFFFFKTNDGRTVNTAHSQDIVAHETAHAIFDGVAPDLYNAITPQALAIHEAVADIAAILCAFRCRELSRRVLSDTGGRIDRPNAFSGIAEQFAGALHDERNYLRNLDNNRRLDHLKNRADPHELSEVLSGALYRVLVKVHGELRKEYSMQARAPAKIIEPEEEAFVQQQILRAPAGGDSIGPALKALFVAAERFKRTVFRGLDYLPPGDVSFADLGRAILAADESSHPDSDQQRVWLRQEFIDRKIVSKASALDVKTNFSDARVDGLDLDGLVQSDYVAYDFANRNRSLLRIPRKISFEVRPRLDVTKLYWHRDGKKEVRECLFKVAWTEVEPNPLGNSFPKKRRVVAGTTLAIDWKTRRVRALLTTTRPKDVRQDTTAFLAQLVNSDTLRLGENALGPGDRPLRGALRGDAFEGALRVHGAARMLHIAREEIR